MLNKGYIFHYCTNVLGLTFVLLNFEYLSEKETKNQTILTHWSVAQAGSNDEKNWWLKISLDCPLNNDVSISKYNTFACTVLHKRRVICKNYQIFSNTIYTFYTLRAIPAAWLRVFIYFEHSRTWGVCLQESQALHRVWTEQLFLMSEKTF